VFNYVNLHLYHYAGNNPVKYTDPDGRTPKSPMEKQVDAVAKVGTFLNENKEAIQKIGSGVGKIVMGLGIASLGVLGGGAITGISGGAAVMQGAAVADLAIASGAAIAAVGAKETIDGLMMMSVGNDKTDHGQQRHGEASGGDPHRNVGDVNKVRQDGKHFLDTETGNTVHVKGDKVVIDTPEGQLHSQFHNTKANTLKRIETGKWIPLE